MGADGVSSCGCVTLGLGDSESPGACAAPQGHWALVGPEARDPHRGFPGMLVGAGSWLSFQDGVSSIQAGGVSTRGTSMPGFSVASAWCSWPRLGAATVWDSVLCLSPLPAGLLVAVQVAVAARASQELGGAVAAG